VNARWVLCVALLSAQIAAAQTPSGPAEPAERLVAAVEARVVLSPTRVFEYEQLVVSVRVTHSVRLRPRWQPPAFEGFWSERLPAEGGPLTHDAAGRAIRTTVFRRALLPTRSGILAIAPSRVWLREGDDEEIPMELGGARVDVRELPESGRPPDFAGLVGQLELKLELDDLEVEVGRALPVTVEIFGRANVWDAPAPEFESELEPDVEVFPGRSELVRGERGGRMTARRTFRFDLVPAKTGRFDVPGFELAYFDPETQRYERARAEPVAFLVVERDRRSATAPWENAPIAERPEARWPSATWLLAGAALAVALAALALFQTRSRRAARPVRESPLDLLRRAEAETAGAQQATLLAAAVRAQIRERHGVETAAQTTGELGERVDDAEALRLLRELDRERWSSGREPPAELLAAIRRYLEETD